MCFPNLSSSMVTEKFIYIHGAQLVWVNLTLMVGKFSFLLNPLMNPSYVESSQQNISIQLDKISVLAIVVVPILCATTCWRACYWQNMVEVRFLYNSSLVSRWKYEIIQNLSAPKPTWYADLRYILKPLSILKFPRGSTLDI